MDRPQDLFCGRLLSSCGREEMEISHEDHDNESWWGLYIRMTENAGRQSLMILMLMLILNRRHSLREFMIHKS